MHRIFIREGLNDSETTESDDEANSTTPFSLFLAFNFLDIGRTKEGTEAWRWDPPDRTALN